jgi:hypothetical protein
MHRDEDNSKDEFSILKQVFGVNPEPQEPASEVRSERVEDFSYEGLMKMPGRFKPGIEKIGGIYPPRSCWQKDESGTVQLYAAVNMVRGMVLNRVVEPTEDGSSGLVSPCHPGTDLPYGVLTRDLRAGERIYPEDIKHSCRLVDLTQLMETIANEPGWVLITASENRSLGQV